MDVAQAAVALGVTERNVRWRLEHGHLKGEKFGKVWAVPEDEVERELTKRRQYADGRLPAGRPRRPPPAPESDNGR